MLIIIAVADARRLSISNKRHAGRGRRERTTKTANGDRQEAAIFVDAVDGSAVVIASLATSCLNSHLAATQSRAGVGGLPVTYPLRALAN